MAAVGAATLGIAVGACATIKLVATLGVTGICCNSSAIAVDTMVTGVSAW